MVNGSKFKFTYIAEKRHNYLKNLEVPTLRKNTTSITLTRSNYCLWQ